MSETARPSRNKFRVPVTRLLVILTATAFLEELLVLFLLDMLPPMRKEAVFVLDKRGNDFAMEMVITAVKNDRQETTHYVAIYNM